MSFNKKTVRDINVSGKRVIVRVDWNVPGDESGAVTDDFRITMSKPTIEVLVSGGASKIILLSHRGRPKSGYSAKLSMEKVAQKAGEVLNQSVEFIAGKFDETMKDRIERVGTKIVLLENTRFDDREKANSLELAKLFAGCGDIFVVDGFAVAHRSDASITGIAKFLPSVAGLLLENEVSALQAAIDHPQQPVLAITGGSKLETKLPLLEKFMKLADQIVVAGVMANTLLVAQGYNIGESVYDKDEIPKAKEMLDLAKASNVSLVLPSRQVAVGKSLADKKRRDVSLKDVEEDDLILDFGDESIVEVLELISQARTIIWNGPLGYYENPVFAKGSQMVAKAIAASDARSVVGGGDTADIVNSLRLADNFTHVSTGGGASLELLAGHKLPAVEVLEDK
ncbi:phosphoglycerate kinase [Candidatus Saccharibacteria bacterium]|nr:phosphoglycerate kinase [Candidatus Saccharibacteria bacterium]